jgi:hypothetical protein
LEILKSFYPIPHACQQSKDDKFLPMALAILLRRELDAQQGLFKLTMKFDFVQTMVEIVALGFDKVKHTIVNSFMHIW